MGWSLNGTMAFPCAIFLTKALPMPNKRKLGTSEYSQLAWVRTQDSLIGTCGVLAKFQPQRRTHVFPHVCREATWPWLMNLMTLLLEGSGPDRKPRWVDVESIRLAERFLHVDLDSLRWRKPTKWGSTPLQKAEGAMEHVGGGLFKTTPKRGNYPHPLCSTRTRCFHSASPLVRGSCHSQVEGGTLA